jgi:hypothetical protein
MFASAARCYSADLVFVTAAGQLSSEQKELETASHFYGVDLKVITVPGRDGELALNHLVRSRETTGVVIAANALGIVNQRMLFRSLKRKGGRAVPLLIVGVTRQTYPSLLRAWSGGAVSYGRSISDPLHPSYVIGRSEGITDQLSNTVLPFSGNDVFYLQLDTNARVQEIMSVRTPNGIFPTLIESTVENVKVFMSCKVPAFNKVADDWSPGVITRIFAEIAPAMIFARYSAGERGWHFLRHYANLTIDDPWLRESYGYLDYKGLLREMQKHNFHSTIAFIPWNYDRSQPEVVSLFRSHPERLSICIHGDNHDHKEFSDYRSKPLADQMADIQQALARMDRFKALTGISYDKVMVFPHSIGPEKTLQALKTYNYLATVNAFNVPMDRSNPSLLPFVLRPATLEYSNFASIRRFPVEVPVSTAFVALNDFLGNPLLFYGHHDLFSGGIDHFDGVADEVNRLQPNTHWASLGEIAKHQYLVKLRADSGYDVLPFVGDFVVENLSGRDSMFYVQKPETDAEIRSVTIDGKDHPFQLRDHFLNLDLSIPAGESRTVLVQYENDLKLLTTDLSKRSVRVYLLRAASDFRDISLPRHAVGRALIQLYYEKKSQRTWLTISLWILTILVVWAGLRYRKSLFLSTHTGRVGTRG